MTTDTFPRVERRVDEFASTFDALTFEGRLMRKATTFLLRFIAPERPQGPDWWSYFGSFGDDIFDDDQP